MYFLVSFKEIVNENDTTIFVTSLSIKGAFFGDGFHTVICTIFIKGMFYQVHKMSLLFFLCIVIFRITNSVPFVWIDQRIAEIGQIDILIGNQMQNVQSI